MIHDWQTSSPGPSSADTNPTAYPQGKWNCRCPHKLSDLATAVTAASAVATELSGPRGTASKLGQPCALSGNVESGSD